MTNSHATFYVIAKFGSGGFWTGRKAGLSPEYPDRLTVTTWTDAQKELRKARTAFPDVEFEIITVRHEAV